MKIKSNIGSALVGTLAFSVGGIILTMGSLNLNKHALNEAKNQNVRFAEDNLRQTVQKVLSDETRCNDNLNENPLVKLTNGTNSIIESGKPFKDGDIHIVDMEIKNPTPNQKIFYLYYTKPSSGAKQKRIPDPDVKCESGDVRGCYYLSCEIIDSSNGCQVHLNGCSLPDDNSQSNPHNCGDNLLSGTRSCFPLQSKFLKNIPRETIENGHTYLTALSGFERNPDNDDNTIQASVEKLSMECPPGQYPIRTLVEVEGEKKKQIGVECLIMCTGGSTLVDNRCECPSDKPTYIAGRCETCPSDRIWDGSNCVCPNDKIEFNDQCVLCPKGSIKSTTSNSCTCDNRAVWDSSSNKCICTDSWYTHHYKLNDEWNCYHCRKGTYFFSGVCKTCPPGQSWINSSCTCPGELQYDFSSQTCKCPGDDHFIIQNNNNCYRCPAGSMPTNSHTACRCQGDGPTWNPETNKCCPNGQHYYSIDQTWNCHRCPSNKRHYYDGNCHKCREGAHIYSGSCIYCPSGSTWDSSNNRCNCSGGRNWMYGFNRNTCECPAGQFYYNRRCNTCLVGQNIYQNKCVTCPEGSTWGNNRCNCSGGRNWDYAHNSRNQCICPSGKHFYNNKCITCPEGSTWDSSNNRCKCTGGKEWNANNNTCNCPSGQHLYSNRCIKCPEGSTWGNNRCNCPGGQEWNSNNNKCECPSDKPNLIDGVCKRCGGTAKWEQAWYNGPKKCVCPKVPGSPRRRQAYYNNTCNECPEGKVVYRRRANGYYYCCPEGPHIQQGRCCPAGKEECGGNCYDPCRGGMWRDATCDCCREGHFCMGEFE